MQLLLRIFPSFSTSIKDAGKTAINRTAKFCKDNAKSIGYTTAMAGMVYGGAGVAKGCNIRLYNYGETTKNVGGSSANLKNVQDSNEIYDLLDIPWAGQPSNPYKKWLKVHTQPYGIELQTDARPENSTTTFHEKLSITDSVTGSGTPSMPVSNKIKFQIIDDANLKWKNIIAERYGLDDVNNPANIKDNWDVKYKNNQLIVLPSINDLTTRVYDNILVKEFNHADLNRDRKVNMKDFAVWSNEFGKNNTTDPNRFGSYVGKDVNDLGAYADINRSGIVDSNDLRLFANEWLWDANAPNTW